MGKWARQVRAFLYYYSAVFWKALKDTCTFFHPELKAVITLFSYFFGLCIYYRLFGWEKIVDKVVETASFFLIPAVVVFFVLFIYNLVLAPFRIWQKNQETILSIDHEKKQLEERFQPKIEIIYKDDSPYRSLQQGPQTYRIGVTNISDVTIEDVRVRLVKIDDRSLIGIELRQTDDLEPRLDRLYSVQNSVSLPLVQKREFRRSFNLNPGDPPKLVDIVEIYKRIHSPPTIELCYASHELNPFFSDGAHELEIVVTAENVKAIPFRCKISTDSQRKFQFQRLSCE